MDFKMYKIGNRVAIKTIKGTGTYSKVTHLTVEDAEKTLKNIRKNNWKVQVINL